MRATMMPASSGWLSTACSACRCSDTVMRGGWPAISSITYLDGELGVLRYRGYPIEQLAERSDFVETSYLLIYGELPTKEQLRYFRASLQRHTLVETSATIHKQIILSIELPMILSDFCYNLMSLNN